MRADESPEEFSVRSKLKDANGQRGQARDAEKAECREDGSQSERERLQCR